MINKLHMAMIELYHGDAKRTQHFCKVHSYAKLIAEMENVDAKTLFILETAALTHDIGIHLCDTYNNIDGIDYQILVEADFLVNMCEDELSEEALQNAYRNIFRTETGKKICREMYDIA